MIREIHLTNELSQLNVLSDFVNLTANEYGLDEKLCMKLKLVMEEAVTNIILYGYKGESDKDIFVRMEKNAGRLLITLTDQGIPFDPTAKETPDTTLSADERPVGGLGIHLIREIMSSVGYVRKDGKNILSMIKELP